MKKKYMIMVKNHIMTDVSGGLVDGSAFANQMIYFSNPSINTFDDSSFDNPGSSQYSPIQHKIAAESYLDPDRRQNNVSGFKYDRKNSTKDIAVYVHHGQTEREKKVLIGHTGTKPSQGHHLRADAALTASTFHKTKIAKDSLSNFDKVQKQYPKHSYHLTGHSLGSFTGAYVHHNRSRAISSSTGYNVPGSTAGMASALVRPFYTTPAQNRVQKNRVEFTNTLDPVSLLNFRKGQKKNKEFTWGVHDLSQWTPKYKH